MTNALPLFFLVGLLVYLIHVFVPFLDVDLAFAFALALGAGADELLDAPVSACCSWTGFIGNDVGGNDACCFGLALSLLTGRCESSVSDLLCPCPVILRCASR